MASVAPIPVAATLPEGPVVVMGGHGERATGRASLIEPDGLSQVSVFADVPDDFAAIAGVPVEAGAAR
ncbi:MAG: hypothetical protein ACYC1E_17285 [Propionibacteriaceae bacterium]